MIKLLKEVDFRQTKANARNVLKCKGQMIIWEKDRFGHSKATSCPLCNKSMPKSQSHGNKAEDALVQLADAEAERDAILSALMALSLTSRQILHYSFCVQDHYSNYKIAREVGYSERSIQRMKSEALIEFAEAYRNGKIIAYK
ncbi:ArpU family phage packaging/lysis transcriptional regulator [Enterococcus faecalis]|uniref:ArpU family phage packaging/lysis transcriptional regulator n=6 Tax=Enterococcus TaxID=1350 RepID=UPI000466D250|nr:ArpU family phage packaging/lysis transcriptional regulator [Enterococcus faecalis]